MQKKIHTTEDNFSSSWKETRWIQRKEEAQLCAASYLWCSELVVFLKGEMSHNTQDLNNFLKIPENVKLTLKNVVCAIAASKKDKLLPRKW